MIDLITNMEEFNIFSTDPPDGEELNGVNHVQLSRQGGAGYQTIIINLYTDENWY